MFQQDLKEQPPPGSFSPFGNYDEEYSPSKLDKRISGISTGPDDNSSHNDFE